MTKRLAVTAGAVALVAGIRWWLLEIQPIFQRYSPGCLFKRFTGWNCPGCGGTRAFYHLLHGELAAAWRMNPLLLTGLGLGLGWWLLRLRAGRASQRGQRPDGGAIRPWVGWLALAVIIGFGLLRNLPWWPFTLLAPR